MNKKKAIKLATATAIAASAFAAATPVQTQAAVNVDAVVKNAVKKMTNAQNSFVAKATDKKLVDVKTVVANQTAATKEYTAAKATVKKLGGKNTAALTAKLDAAKKTMDYRIKMYVDARKEVSALAVVNQATKKADIAQLEAKVAELEAQLAKTEALVAKVIGSSTRDKMTAVAVTPSKATVVKAKADLEAAKTLKVEEVTAVDAKTLTVKFEGKDAVKVTLDKELTDGQKEVTFTYEGKEYKATLKAAFTTVAKVEDVKAVNTKTLKVAFNKSIEDTSKASFIVKRGNVEVAVTAKWADDKKSVELASSGNLVAGDYTVTVNGLDIKENSKTAKVEAEKVVAVQILDSKIEFGKDTAPVSFKVFNQYNEEMTVTADKFTWTAYNKTQNASIGFNAAVGGLTLDTNDAGVKEGDQVLLAGVLKSDATVQVTKTVTVSKIVASDITLQQPVLPEKAVRLMQNAGYVEVPYTLKDAEGNAITFPETAEVAINSFDVNGVKLTTENNNIVTHVKVDAKGKLWAKVADVAGDVTVTGLVKSTGKVAVLNFKVNANAFNDTITLGSPEKQLTAGGAVVKVPLTVTDQYGATVDASKVKDGDFIVSPSNTGVITGAQISADGKYLELTPGTKGTSSVIVTSKASGKSATVNVDVKDAAVATDLNASISSANVTKGADVVVKGSVFNQYTDELTGNLADYHVEVDGAEAADKAAITNADANVTNLDTFKKDGVALTVKPDTTATTITLNVKLVKNADSSVIANKVFKVNVASSTSALSYTLAPVEKLHGLAGDNANSEYAKELTLTAKDASGNVVAIPYSKIVGATSENTSLVKVEKNNNGKYVVYGLAGGITGTDTEKTTTVRLLVEDLDGTVKTVSTNVTVSKEALQAVSIKSVDDTDATKAVSTFTIVDGDANGTLNELVTGLNVLGDDNNFKFVVTDQFGGTSLTAKENLVITTTGLSKIALGTGGTNNATLGFDNTSTVKLTEATGTDLVATTYTADASFVITASTTNGKTASVVVKFGSASSN